MLHLRETLRNLRVISGSLIGHMGNTSPKSGSNFGQDTSAEPGFAETPLTVVWCDAAIGTQTNNEDDNNTLHRLAHIANRRRQLVHAFDELNACRDFIQHVNNVCLIVSGSMGEQLVPLVEHLDQIHTIFVFCMNRAVHERWARQYRKVRGVHTEIEDICQRLRAYFPVQVPGEYDLLHFDMLPSHHHSSPENERQELPFVYGILSGLAVSNMHSSRNEMIQYCRNEYPSPYHRALIDQFDQQYANYNPVWWFTRDRFLQNIINRALITHDLYSLSVMNPFLKDLDEKLVELQREPNTIAYPLTLYFSQSLANDDFHGLQANQGGEICVNQFLFANPERAIATMFLEDQAASPATGNTTNVLFHLSIYPESAHSTRYASIGTASLFVHQREYLISPASLFHIDYVERLAHVPSAWSVHLTLVDREDLDLKPPIPFDDTDSLEQLAPLVQSKLSQFKLTRAAFRDGLGCSIRQTRSILLHYHMGIVLCCLNEFTRALDEYRLSINLARNAIPGGHQTDNLCLVPMYSTMGTIFQELNKNKEAFEYTWRSLRILQEDLDDSTYKQELTTACYMNIGLVHEQQGQTGEARNFYRQAARIQRKYLPPDHPDCILLQETIDRL